MEIEDTLHEIVELGYVAIRDGRITDARKPIDNICSSTWDRWTPTLQYLADYARYHPEFGGDFFVCLYDGWREYGEPVLDPAARRHVPWSELGERELFLGRGNAGEQRFRHGHPDTTLYPDLCLPVLTYNRHVGDTNSLLIPDAEFLADQFTGFAEQVTRDDVQWSDKAPKMIWHGSPNLTDGYAYAGGVHPRQAIVQMAKYMPFTLEASFQHAPISWMLRHKYILDVDGMVSAWSGLYWKLLSNSLVIKAPTHWEQWYYDQMQPGVHYVALPEYTTESLATVYNWCIKNDAECADIARNGRDLAKRLTYEYAVREYIIR